MILSKQTFLPIAISGLLSISLTSCFHDDDPHTDDHDHDSLTFTLNSDEVISLTSVSSSADVGVASFMLHADDGEITGSVTFPGTGDTPTLLHIHSGYAGQNGAVVIALTDDDTDGVWDIPAENANFDMDTFNAGGYYLNSHYAEGKALRVQLMSHDIEMRFARLIAPGTTTDGGFAAVTVDTTDRSIIAHATFPSASNNGGVKLRVDTTTVEEISLTDSSTGGDKLNFTSATGDSLSVDAMEVIETGGWHVDVINATDSGVNDFTAQLPAIESHH